MSARETLRALFRVPRTGAQWQWRSLPSDFGLWQTVRHYFRKRGGEGCSSGWSARRGGGLADRVMERVGARLEVAMRPKLPGGGFAPAGRRWVVERAFA